MTARIRLPRVLFETVNTKASHEVDGATVREAFSALFEVEPGLRHHIVDETGTTRPHVSVFVDGHQADLDTAVAEGSDIRVLHAVSGGSPASQQHGLGSWIATCECSLPTSSPSGS